MNANTMLGLIPATPEDLALCAHEPIHIPGAIQPHGVLLAVCPETLIVSHASENLAGLLGIEAGAALGKPLDDVLGAATRQAIEAAISADAASRANVPKLLLLPLAIGPRHAQIQATKSCIIIEIEHAPAEAAGPVIMEAQAILAKLRDTRSLSDLSDRVVRELRRFTGYDRVMLYRFDPEGHGEVIAEDRDPLIEPYMGLRYPASDIPAQARRLYLLVRLRVIPQVAYEPVKVLTEAWRADAPPLEMSTCILRSVSPIHLEYLRNMGVAATLAISIIQDQRLWGLIVCHHGQPRMIPPPVGATCDLIGQLLGLLIAEIDERDRMVQRMDRDASLSIIAQLLDTRAAVLDGLRDAGPHLLNIVGAAGVVIQLAGRSQSHGAVPDGHITAAILQTLRNSDSDEIVAVDNLAKRHPEFAPWQANASGVLAMPISNDPGDAIIWFRPEIVQTVSWGGDPAVKAHVEPATKTLSPRKSFSIWKEIVDGVSAPWTAADLGAAAILRRILTRSLLRQTEAELFRISNSDPLTGLANRTVLNQRLEQWRLAEQPTQAALLFFDLDRFKTVNDSLGHYAGDDLLRETAQRLSKIVEPPGLLVRLGGDEFVIFLENVSVKAACRVADAVLRQFVDPFTVAGRPHRAATSVGLAHTTSGAADLLREADAAMYAAKRQGGNRYVLFETKLHESARNRLRTEQDLFLAMERQEMSVAYQPIVTLPGAAPYGFEALARWYHAERGWISPAEFIPLAEETGQINEIGRWIAKQALSALFALDHPGLHMTINVSGHQLLRGVFADDLAHTIAAKSINPRNVTIEVTESTLMQDDAVRELTRVRDIGCRVALDDFGTGYSSLAYLQRLPVDIIKIDRSFVSPLGSNTRAERFAKALIDLVHTLGLTVIAEGVETAEQAEMLAHMSCDHAQGYHFGRPAPDCINYLPA
jgi:diguanylate cyclase (GGDEF)-like protein